MKKIWLLGVFLMLMVSASMFALADVSANWTDPQSGTLGDNYDYSSYAASSIANYQTYGSAPNAFSGITDLRFINGAPGQPGRQPHSVIAKTFIVNNSFTFETMIYDDLNYGGRELGVMDNGFQKGIGIGVALVQDNPTDPQYANYYAIFPMAPVDSGRLNDLNTQAIWTNVSRTLGWHRFTITGATALNGDRMIELLIDGASVFKQTSSSADWTTLFDNTDMMMLMIATSTNYFDDTTFSDTSNIVAGCVPNFVCTDKSYCHRNYNINNLNNIEVCTTVKDTEGCFFPANLTIKRELMRNKIPNVPVEIEDTKNNHTTYYTVDNMTFKVNAKYNDWWDSVDTVTCVSPETDVNIEIKGYNTSVASPDGKLKIEYKSNELIPPSDITSWLSISSTSVVLNEEGMPHFNKPAKISMTKIISMTQPTVYVDRGYLGWVVCAEPTCTNIEWKYDSKAKTGDLKFDVTGFSGYDLNGLTVPYEQRYTTGDLRAITGDIIGSAGAELVGWVGLLVLFAVIGMIVLRAQGMFKKQ